jgi:hypothetical protein
MASQLAIFAIVVAIALILTGVGLIIVAYAVFLQTPGESAPAPAT